LKRKNATYNKQRRKMLLEKRGGGNLISDAGKWKREKEGKLPA